MKSTLSRGPRQSQSASDCTDLHVRKYVNVLVAPYRFPMYVCTNSLRQNSSNITSHKSFNRKRNANFNSNGASNIQWSLQFSTALQSKQIAFNDITLKSSARSAQSFGTSIASLASCVYGQCNIT